MRWTIGVSPPDRDDSVIALTLDEVRAAKLAHAGGVRFDELLAGAEVEPADEVFVRPSMWRGHGFIALCEWIVCAKLAAPGSHVMWTVPARGGATGVRKVLTARGWEFTETRAKDKRHRHFEGGAPPGTGEQPAARSFTASLGGRELSFEADWGVFSLGHIDEGTRALFEAASSVDAASVADVGTGYGAVAVGLAMCGPDTEVVASDVDLVALHLAWRNAAVNGVTIELIAEDDPSVLKPTELTTCEIPTHVSPGQTKLLVEGLVARSRDGVVLVAVHNGLVERYVRLLTDVGADARVDDGDTHAILTLGG